MRPPGLLLAKRHNQFEALRGISLLDKDKIVTPTVTGGCAGDPTCDLFDIFGDGVDAQVVRPAASNLLYALDPDNPSFEGGTLGTWLDHLNSAASVSTTYAHNGIRSLKQIATGAPASTRIGITAVVAAGAQYIFGFLFKGTAGRTYVARMSGDVSGATDGTSVVATGDWQLATCVKTFNIADTNMQAYLICSDAINGDIAYYDAISLYSGSVPHWFVNGDGTAMNCTVPVASLPTYPGGPISVVCVVNTPWPGNDGLWHYLLELRGTAWNRNTFTIEKSNGDSLRGIVYDDALAVRQCSQQVNATNWPAGVNHVVIITRHKNGEVYGWLDRVAFATQNSGAGTGLETVTNLASIGVSATTCQINGPIHCAIFNRVFTAAERTAIWDYLGVS